MGVQFVNHENDYTCRLNWAIQYPTTNINHNHISQFPAKVKVLFEKELLINQ